LPGTHVPGEGEGAGDDDGEGEGDDDGEGEGDDDGEGAGDDDGEGEGDDDGDGAGEEGEAGEEGDSALVHSYMSRIWLTSFESNPPVRRPVVAPFLVLIQLFAE
jgi:hypothetical protein